MKYRLGFNKDKTPREEVFLEGDKDFLDGNDPFAEPRGNPVHVRHYFAMVPQDLLFDGGLSMGAKALYGIYHCYAVHKHNPQTYVTRERVGRHLGVSTKHVSTLKRELAEAGWIEIKRRGQGKADLITLNEYPFQGKNKPRREVEVPSRRHPEVSQKREAEKTAKKETIER